MKIIIDNKLYDTTTAMVVSHFYESHNYEVVSYLYGVYHKSIYEQVTIFKTKKGQYLKYWISSDDRKTEHLALVGEEWVKDVLSKHSPNEYLLEFGKVEEG